MQVKSIAECSKGSILQYSRPFIKLPVVINTFVLSILSGRFTQILLYFDFVILTKRKKGNGTGHFLI